METQERVGEYLRSLRIAAGLKPEQVAVALGTGVSTIYRIETGAGDARASLLLSYCSLVGGSGDDLMALYRAGQPAAA